MRTLIGSDDNLGSLCSDVPDPTSDDEECAEVPAGDHANDDNSASDDDDNDDDVEIRDGDDDDNDDDVEIRDEDVSPTAGMPEFASAGPPAVSPDMPETAAVGLTPISLSTLGADVDNSPGFSAALFFL